MAFAWACCLAMFLEAMGWWFDSAGMEGTQMERGVLLEIA